ncbi:GSCOCG00012536001-RA-CDS, partial [Cotesia congregata]
KPKELVQYFNKLIIEINDLQLNGLKIDDNLFSVKINSIVCDTPARSFIKGVKHNGGFHACERCTVVGKKIDGTTVYGFDDAFLRTDESFRAYDDPEHHRKITPLITIKPPIDMVRSIVLDPMHLLDNGVTSKLLNYWYNGEKKIKISKTNWEYFQKDWKI